MRCNNEGDKCPVCPREFVLNIEAVATVTKDGEGMAIIQTMDHAFFHPFCGGEARSIQTTIPFDKVMRLLDGRVLDMGEVAMTYYRDTL